MTLFITRGAYRDMQNIDNKQGLKTLILKTPIEERRNYHISVYLCEFDMNFKNLDVFSLVVLKLKVL